MVTSLRGLQQTTTLTQVQARLGSRQTSLRALSETAYVFDATLLHEVRLTLGAHLRPPLSLAEQAALAPLLAVGGSLLPALPRMAWALWQDDQPRAANMHGAFAVLPHGPVEVTGTAGNGRSGPSGDAWCRRAASRWLIGALLTIACFRRCMTCRAVSSVG